MTNSKLISVLKTLNKKEFKKLGEFINSPFFNKNENIKRLYLSLEKRYPDFPVDITKIEIIFFEVYENSEFDYHKISNLNSDLLQLIKSYFAVKSFQENAFYHKLFYMKELDNRKLDFFYTQADGDIQSMFEMIKLKDEDYYFRKYIFNKNRSMFNSISSSKISFDPIQTEYDSLYEFSFTAYLKLFAKMLYNKNHGKVNYSIPAFTELWNYIQNTDLPGNVVYDVYKSILKLELSKEESDYLNLKKLKHKYMNYLSKEDLHNVFIFMNSFISYRLNKYGDEKYYKDRFEVLKESVDYGFVDSSHIYFSDYTYYFISACTVEEYSWAENFMNKFKEGIFPSEETENCLNFCKAFINYRKKNFERALEYFALTKFRLFFLKVTVKSFTVRILYELNLEEEALSSIDAFRHYLKSEKIILEEQKKAHYEFLKFTTELFRIRNDISFGKSAEELTESIKKMDNSAYGVKSWLLKKAEELKSTG